LNGRGKATAADDGAELAQPLYDIPASQIRARRTEWFWKDRLEWGVVAILQGGKAAGKSTWARYLAAVVTGQAVLPGHRGKPKLSGNVLWYAGEEALETRVRPGLAAAGADLERCFLADRQGDNERQQLRLPGDCQRLTERIRERRACLVVIDPIFNFTDGSCDLGGPTEDARRFMRELGRVAHETGALILLLRNTTKDTSRGALSAGRGSGELGNAARCVLHAQAIEGQPGEYGLAVGACNAGRPVLTLTYRLADADSMPRIEITGETELTADELAGGEEADLDRSLKEQAKRLLRTVLADGRVDSKIIKAKGEEAMISIRTLQAAAKELGVMVERQGRREDVKTFWHPPKRG
jgi:hypothetical protein